MDIVSEIVKKIRKGYPDLEDDGSKEILEDLVRREKQLQDKIEIFSNPLLQGFIKERKEELEKIDYELANNRKMTQEERDLMFEKKSLIKSEMEHFDVKYFEKQLKDLEEEARGYVKKLREL